MISGSSRCSLLGVCHLLSSFQSRRFAFAIDSVTIYSLTSPISVKRLDSILRSPIYSAFGEILEGLASIRAYQHQHFYTNKIEKAIDMGARAYLQQIILQRWLGVRLDLLAAIVVLGIGLFGVGYRESINPSKLGATITYSLSIAQTFSS